VTKVDCPPSGSARRSPRGTTSCCSSIHTTQADSVRPSCTRGGPLLAREPGTASSTGRQQRLCKLGSTTLGINHARAEAPGEPSEKTAACATPHDTRALNRGVPCREVSSWAYTLASDGASRACRQSGRAGRAPR
jgi:hypothetical protein